jgi:hypothetical protein
VTRQSLWLWAIGVVSGLIIVIGVLVVVPAVLYPPLPDADLQRVPDPQTRIGLQQAQGQLQNNMRSTLLQVFAGLLVVMGAAATWRQVQVNRDGQITDRFSRAVEHLANDNVDVRIGGLYVLERIAKDSPRDRRFVQVTMGSFLRNRSPWPATDHPTQVVDESLPWLRLRAPDVQTALAILARRPPARDAPSLLLSLVDLRSVELENRELTGAIIRRSNLARARLRGTRLDGCDFYATDLRRADLTGVSLRKASLRNAYLEGADLCGADLTGADLRGTDMRAVNLDKALLAGAHVDSRTIWPRDFAPARVSASLFSD